MSKPISKTLVSRASAKVRFPAVRFAEVSNFLVPSLIAFAVGLVFPLYATNPTKLVPAPAIGNAGDKVGQTAEQSKEAASGKAAEAKAQASKAKGNATVLQPKNKAPKGRDWKPAPVQNR